VCKWSHLLKLLLIEKSTQPKNNKNIGISYLHCLSWTRLLTQLTTRHSIDRLTLLLEVVCCRHLILYSPLPVYCSWDRFMGQALMCTNYDRRDQLFKSSSSDAMHKKHKQYSFQVFYRLTRNDQLAQYYHGILTKHSYYCTTTRLTANEKLKV